MRLLPQQRWIEDGRTRGMPKRGCSERWSKEGSEGLTGLPGFEDEEQQRWWSGELGIDRHGDEAIEPMLVPVEIDVGGVGDSFLVRWGGPQKRPGRVVAKALTLDGDVIHQSETQRAEHL